MAHRFVDSPFGPLTLVVDAAGALARISTLDQKHLPSTASFGELDDSVADEAAGQLAEYFSAKRCEFDLELSPVGTPFQRRVWAELQRIPFGETATYGQIAERLGAPKSARAVGAAVGRNPLLIVVPCHRVVAASGDLIGFAAGIDTKRWLLAHEREANQRQPGEIGCPGE